MRMKDPLWLDCDGKERVDVGQMWTQAKKGVLRVHAELVEDVVYPIPGLDHYPRRVEIITSSKEIALSLCNLDYADRCCVVTALVQHGANEQNFLIEDNANGHVFVSVTVDDQKFPPNMDEFVGITIIQITG